MAASLKAQLGNEQTRPGVVSDCVELVESQVKAKSGLSGVAIKGAYGTIKRIKPGVVSEVIDSLLDEWLDKMQPYYDQWDGERSGAFGAFITAHASEVAEGLLEVTDRRAERSRHRTAKKAYQRMRASAKVNVVEAVPALGEMIEKHIRAAEAAAGASS